MCWFSISVILRRQGQHFHLALGGEGGREEGVDTLRDIMFYINGESLTLCNIIL